MPSLKKPTAKKTVAKKTIAKKTTKAKPVEEVDAPMKYFVCDACKNKYLDTNEYFYGKKSKRCLWCTKFPKTRDIR